MKQKEEKYSADFLWPCQDGSVEEAGYEFANAKTEEYQKLWWDILKRRLTDGVTRREW